MRDEAEKAKIYRRRFNHTVWCGPLVPALMLLTARSIPADRRTAVTIILIVVMAISYVVGLFFYYYMWQAAERKAQQK